MQRHHRAANEGEQPHQEVRLRQPAALAAGSSGAACDRPIAARDRRETDSTEIGIVSMCNPHNPSIFRQFARVSVPIAGNLRQN